MTIYCRFYKGVKFVVVVSSISWLVAGMVEVEEKQLDDRCEYLMLVESQMCAAGRSLRVADVGRAVECAAGRSLWVADVDRVVDVCCWTIVAGS